MIYSLGSFQMCNTVLLTSVTMLYITFAGSLRGASVLIMSFYFSKTPGWRGGTCGQKVCFYSFL